jgi:signal transduction histidine kinase
MRKAVVLLLAAGLLVILGAVRINDVWSSHGEAIEQMHARVASDALVLAEYVSGIFGAGDAALRQLVLQSQRLGGPSAPESEWAPVLSAAGAGLRGIGAISIIDRGLVIRHSNRRAIVGQPRGTEAGFARAVADGAPDALIVGPPFKSPVTGVYVIPLGRRLLQRDGTFDGVVVASFLPAQLREFFRSINVGARGAAAVFHTAGAIVVSEPSSSDAVGMSTEGNVMFAAATRGQAKGVVEGPLVSDGPVKVSGFQHVAGLPLIVTVSLDRQEMLAPWRRELRGVATTHAIVSIVVISVLFVLFRQIDAKAYAELQLLAARQAEAERLRDTNEQLSALLEREQAARRDAEAAIALKDQFVMTVSHELRTPLTAIAGWARMLVDGMVSEDKREGALRSIERNAQTQKRLIEDLLDIAGTMAGKLRLDVRSIAAADIIRSAVDAVVPAANAKGVHLQVHIDADVGSVAADPERLQQIVWNLLSNGVKFTPAGGTVTLSVARTARALRISVSDTGAGISADLLPHVFDRFRQGTGGISRRHGGLGLGLAIVRNLVELHGGTVSAHSAGEGRGATFEVELPAV